MKRFLLFVGLLLLSFTTVAQDDPITVTDAFGDEVVIEDASRIITVGGAVTEIAYALDAGDQIIAVDDSSLYPREAMELPSVGYLRFLTAEPILALDPTLIIATEDVGPPEVVEQLRDSGITFLIVPAEDTVDGTAEKIQAIAAALGRADEGEALVKAMLEDVETAQELVETAETTPRVMFLFLRGAAVITVSGTDTGADEMIRLAGGENVMTDYEGYQPLTAEAIIAAEPDVILTTTDGLESVGGMEGLLELPGIAQTPAAENDRIIATMDDLELLGFTPRLGEAVLSLTYELHEDLEPPADEMSSETSALTVLEVLEESGEFEILLEGIGIANQADLLNGEGPFTIFAPNDDAFGKLPEETLESLYSSAISVGFVLSNHYVFQQVLSAEDLIALDGETVKPMYFGGNLLISVDEEGNVRLSDEATVIVTDIPAANGVIHVIDTVMIPPRPGQ